MRKFFVCAFFCLVHLSEKLCAQDARTLLPQKHTGQVTGTDISPDKKKLLTTSLDGTVKLWDLQKNILLVNYGDCANEGYTARFINNGSAFVVLSRLHRIKIVNAINGKDIATLSSKEGKYTYSDPEGQDFLYQRIDFSPNAKLLVAVKANYNGAVVWDLSAKKIVCEVPEKYDHLVGAVISPDNKYFYLYSQSNELTQWDIGKQTQVNRLGGIFSDVSQSIVKASTDGTKIVSIVTSQRTPSIIYAGPSMFHSEYINAGTEIYNACFSPDGNMLYLLTADENIQAWSVDKNAGFTPHLLSRYAIKDKHPVSVDISPDGKNMLLAINDSSLVIWNNFKDNGKQEVKKIQRPVQSAEYDESGNGIILITRDNDFAFMDTKGETPLPNVAANTSKKEVPSFPIDFTDYCPSTKTIAIIRKISLYKNELRVWNLETGTSVFSLQGQVSSYVKLSSSGSLVLCQGSEIYDLQSGKRVSRLKNVSSLVSAEFSANDQLLAIVSQDGFNNIHVGLWDVHTGNFLGNLCNNNNAGDCDNRNAGFVSFSPDNSKIISSVTGTISVVCDFNTRKELYKLQNIQSAEFSPDSKTILVLRDKYYMQLLNAENGEVLSAGTESIMAGAKRQLTENLNNPDEQMLKAFPQMADSNYRKKTIPRANKIADSMMRIAAKMLSPEYSQNNSDRGTPYVYATFSKINNRIVAFTYDGVAVLDTRKFIELNRYPIEGKPGFLDNHPVCYGNFTLDNKGNAILITDLTGQCDSVLFLPVDSSNFILSSSTGYYYCSPDAAKKMSFMLKGSAVIPFQQLDVKFNRPDKMLRDLGSSNVRLTDAYYHAYLKRMTRLGIDTTSFREGVSVPEADFLNRNSIQTKQTNDKLDLTIKGNDNSYILDRYNVWVNDVPVFGLKGESIRSKASKDFTGNVSITLSQGINHIETSVLNTNGIESYRVPVSVEYIPAQPKKVKVWFVGIGINRFEDSSNNLRYCQKDIRDIAAKLRQKYGEDLEIDTLFNEDVTIEKVKALKQRLLQSQEDDKVIIAYSGHGLLSKQYDYFLSTYNVNFKQPEQNGLAYEELENLVDGIRARKKLMLIDACHSGEIDKEEMQRIAALQEKNQTANNAGSGARGIELPSSPAKLGMKNSFELMQQLFVNVGKGTGTTIISAAGGTQSARETTNLKNGVFTYSILGAMNKYPVLKISELKKIVGQRVEELTNGLQKPTSRNETLGSDWEL